MVRNLKNTGFTKKLNALLVSPLACLALMAALILASLAGTLLPQVGVESPAYFERWRASGPWGYAFVHALQLDQVFTSVWFLVLVFTMTIALSYSVGRQLVALLRGRRKGARKGGGTLFHVGLLLVILASLHMVAFQKRGFIQLIETDTYLGDEASLLSKNLGVFADGFEPGFSIRLRKLEQAFWDNGRLKKLKSHLTLTGDGPPVDVTLGINRRISYGGVTLYQTNYRGYTISLLLGNGKDAFFTHVSLDIPGSPNEPYVGVSDIPTTPYTVRMKFFPDRTRESHELNKPILKLAVERGGETVFDGAETPFPGNPIELPSGDRLSWRAVRPWSGIRLVRSAGTPLVFAGFGLLVVGLVMLYIVSPR